MKIKAVRTYSDMYTGVTVHAGDTVEYDAQRAKELIKKGVAVKAEKTAEKAK